MLQHYTELILRLERDSKHADKRALRDWLDLFTHRLLSFFYRAWEKYRFFIPYERRRWAEHPPDPFTHALLSLSGLGLGTLRNRIRVSHLVDDRGVLQSQALARVEDLSILHYAGLLARRPRNAAGLAAMLTDYFAAPVEVRQFQGQWLTAHDPADQNAHGHARRQLPAGRQRGDRRRASVGRGEGKIRLRIGPLRATPNSSNSCPTAPPRAEQAFFLLSHLTRLYIGPTARVRPCSFCCGRKTCPSASSAPATAPARTPRLEHLAPLPRQNRLRPMMRCSKPRSL